MVEWMFLCYRSSDFRIIPWAFFLHDLCCEDFLSSALPIVARRNRKRQPRKRRVHAARKKNTHTVVAWIKSLVCPHQNHCRGCERLSLDPTCPPLTRFCRIYTWQIHDHVLLIKLKWPHLSQRRNRRGAFKCFSCFHDTDSDPRVCVWLTPRQRTFM